MKQFYFSFLFLFFFSMVIGQNYALLSEDKETIFDFKNNSLPDGSHLINDYSNEFWISAHRKTIGLINGDSLILHSRIAKNQEFHISNNCLAIGDTSWLGTHTIIQNNGNHLFFNRYGDTITCKPQANLTDNWMAFEWQNGNYIQATVLNITLETISTAVDSVKTIVFQVKDSLHQNISHLLNGFQIRISKNFGLVKSVNFYDFPNDTSSIYLIGHSNLNTPIRNIKYQDAYNFDIGDELHIESFGQNIPTSVSFHYEIQRIIGKAISTDTIIYNIERQQIHIDRVFQNTGEDTTYTMDTIVNIVPLNVSFQLDSLPFVIDTVKYTSTNTFYSLNHTKLSYSNTYNRLVKTSAKIGDYWLYPCLKPVLDIFPCDKNYIEGLGGNYFDCQSWGNIHRRELVFYKKNSGTWGTPININSLIPTSISNLKRVQSISIFPNPTTNQITISTKNKVIASGQITIFNSSGQEILSIQETHLNKKSFDVNDWTTGIYFVKIQSENSVWIGKFVKQ